MIGRFFSTQDAEGRLYKFYRPRPSTTQNDNKTRFPPQNSDPKKSGEGKKTHDRSFKTSCCIVGRGTHREAMKREEEEESFSSSSCMHKIFSLPSLPRKPLSLLIYTWLTMAWLPRRQWRRRGVSLEKLYCTECVTNFLTLRKIRNVPKWLIFQNAPMDTNIFSLLFSYFELKMTGLRHQTAPIKLSKEKAAKPF